jgi:hypothetical protein
MSYKFSSVASHAKKSNTAVCCKTAGRCITNLHMMGAA